MNITTLFRNKDPEGYGAQKKIEDKEAIIQAYEQLATVIKYLVPEDEDRLECITRLQESCFWAKHAIINHAARAEMPRPSAKGA